MIKITAFGGYSKIGKSMTAIRIDDKIIITDMGADIERLVNYEEEERNISVKNKEPLLENGIIPDDRELYEKDGSKVIAIVLTHGHLDHIWAAPFLAGKYKCPVICSPFTERILSHIAYNMKSKDLQILKINTGTNYKLADGISIELVHITHSIPNSTVAVIHTKYGAIAYANDWKFDNFPTLGNKPNYERLEALGREGIFALISDSTNVDEEGFAFSESVVKMMLEDVIRKSLSNKTIFITTFSSHIARIKNITEISRKLGREVLVFGRSMDMYLSSAINVGIIKKSEVPPATTRANTMNNLLRQVSGKPGKYVIICTGHQGEPGAFLDKLATGRLNYRLSQEDGVIFSSRTIPTPLNIANRGALQRALQDYGVSIADNIHASGHAYRNEQKEFLKMLKPKHYIPSHGGLEKLTSAIGLSKELGYELNKNAHILLDRQEIVLD